MNDSARLSEFTEQNEVQTPEASPVESVERRPLRLWLPVIVLIAYWVVVLFSYQAEMAMFYRFISRMIALAVLMLFFLVWWFACRRFRWFERLALVAFLLLCLAGTSQIADPSMDFGVLILAGIPSVLTLGTGWGLLVRKRSARTQLVGAMAIIVSVFGVLATLRWDGLDGRQQAQFNWRWTPTAEERYLATVQDSARTPSRAGELEAKPGDWTAFRGSDSTVTGATFGDWSKEPPKELWHRLIGPAWSSMIIVDDRLFTQDQRGESEVVACFDANTGDELWNQSLTTRFEEGLSGPGPRATPTFAGGRIYAMGATGNLLCLDAGTGAIHWQHDLVSEFSAKVPQWGIATSPLVIGDMVVVFAGGQPDQALIAFDAISGKKRWACAGGTESYSSPQLLTIHGHQQIVMQDKSAFYAVRPEDGKRLWDLEINAADFMAMLQPHLVDETDLVAAWESGIARFRIYHDESKWRIEKLWTSNRLKPGFNDFVIHKGHIYGLDDGIFCCVSLEDGQRKWKRGRYGFGQILLLPDHDEVLVLTEKGEVVRVKASPDKHEEHGRFKAIEGKTWNHPVLCHQRLYVRNAQEMACFGL